jgi:hypothetical protein
MEAILKKYDVKISIDKLRDYVNRHDDQPGVEFAFAQSIIFDNNMKIIKKRDLDRVHWDVVAKYMKKILAVHPTVMLYERGMSIIGSASNNESIQEEQDELLKPLSKPLLNIIEPMIEKQPSSLGLWQQWLFWRGIAGEERPIEGLISSIKLSPLSATAGTILPSSVMESYYQECIKNNDWPKLIKLLEPVWERESFRIDAQLKEDPGKALKYPRLGDGLAIPLMEAYLHESKSGDANDIFNYWLNSGGKFTDISKIVELAKEMGNERLAREWGGRVKDSGR